jgi:hypothetical protein
MALSGTAYRVWQAGQMRIMGEVRFRALWRAESKHM